MLFSDMKTSERDMARKLRRDGRSIRDRARLVGVSKSSVSCWVRDKCCASSSTIFGAIQEYGGFERPEWLD
jgi:hypothetical protein